MSCVADREEFLQEANVAVLSTVDAEGSPHAMPVWYLYDNGEFIVSTGRGSQKHRNVQRNPNVALLVDKRTLPYYAVMAQGAVEIGAPLSDDDRLRMAVRYLGEELGSAYVARTTSEDSITLRLRPRKLVEYHGRAGRVVTG